MLALLRLIAASLLLAIVACDAPPPQNLVLISLDTLVPERMSTYGNPRETTPAVTRLAAEGLIFTRAYSPSPWTLPAHASMLTGLYPMSLSPSSYDKGLFHAAPLLSERFREKGYRTGAVTGGAYVSAAFGADRGFDSFAIGAAPGAVRWLEESPGEPFFLFFHTYLPHGLYTDRRFAKGQPAGRLGGVFSTGRGEFDQAICCAEPIELTEVEREYLLALYDSDIAAADDAVASILEAIERVGVADHTTVIVTSDHGEEFWQHTGWATRHGHTLYDELLRIPLVWKEPGLATAGGTTDAVVNLVDLVPTLVRRFGLAAPEKVDGLDLSPVLDGQGAIAERPLFAGGIRDGADSHSVRTPKAKLIETPEPERQRGLGRRFPVPVPARRELYLADDHGERTNAALTHPELTAELTELLDAQLKRSPSPPERPPQPEIDEETRRRLEELGYVE